jgi:hypothetical protein
MRLLPLVVSLCMLLPGLAFADAAEAQLMAQAQRAYLAGDLLNSAHLFQQVLATDPQNTLAIEFLRKIRAGAANAVAPPQNEFSDLIFDKIAFNNASFEAALNLLKEQAAKHSVSVSFVPQLPESQMQHPVSLSLNNIPFLEALRYLCQLNGATYSVEPYAIVIKPAVPGNSAQAPAQ